MGDYGTMRPAGRGLRSERTRVVDRRGPIERIRRRRAVVLSLVGAGTIIGALAFAVIILGPLSWWLAADIVHDLRGKEQADAFNAVRQTVLIALGGAATLVGAAYTARSFALTRRGQVTDRFAKATTQLASNSLEERLGGIYALEHIMAESSRDHATVLEILCAFIRIHAPAESMYSEELTAHWKRDNQLPWPPFGTGPAADVQAAVTVLARRPSRPEPHRPTLLRTSLARISAREHEFESAPRLNLVFFTDSDLRAADFRGADLSGSIMNYADLRWAAFERANLTGTRLHRADLRNAYMQGADLTSADLTGANMAGATYVTAEQLAKAHIDEETILPSSLGNDPWVLARIADCSAFQVAGERKNCPPPTPNPSA